MTRPHVIDGNIFTTKAQTLVNTVNCVGVMGAGIALECRLRYPDMFSKYAFLCHKGEIQVGSLWIYKAPDRWILNFPTKFHWKEPSLEEYLHAGLKKFMSVYEEKKIESIAFPLLGAQNGGIEPSQSQSILQSYLCKCKIPVEIYRYDPLASDDLFNDFRAAFLNFDSREIMKQTGLRSHTISKIHAALKRSDIRQLNALASFEGIGIKTLEKAFVFAKKNRFAACSPMQQTLSF